jgi:hypothetical protein
MMDGETTRNNRGLTGTKQVALVFRTAQGTVTPMHKYQVSNARLHSPMRHVRSLAFFQVCWHRGLSPLGGSIRACFEFLHFRTTHLGDSKQIFLPGVSLSIDRECALKNQIYVLRHDARMKCLTQRRL